MTTGKLIFILFAVAWSRFVIVTSLRLLSGDHYCDQTHLPSPQALRSDQFTVLINGYSESRIRILQTVTGVYSSSPSVAAVVVLWGNPKTPSKTLVELSHNLSISSPGDAPISVLRQPSSSLNARFLPRPWISTRAVLICDDDIEVDPKSIQFAFNIWRSHSNNLEQLVGLFARSHEIDLTSRSWIYTVHPDRYSILLTKFMLMKTEYLYQYSCEGGTSMAEARSIVDEMRNCEDILMNFVAANKTGVGPVLVGAKRVRDWGDARNDGGRRRRGLMAAGEEVSVGLSSRKKGHRKSRGDCIKEFHRVLGKMPLRYSYGKMVDSIGEQGLCEKSGKLVFCDQQLSN
ncbi:glycosyltransferase family protein 64 C3 [Cynara cardunculus var. scolymus]|uniref:EXTL2, alpha-1,4-N-acetylhexosaminyltransferase n=1 Tax=Cynara cardunculus var. scolymus TaxID=59895 RepID=A0A118JWG5_CYNCS|nr:glycosyltransferase family protein 64 C3 [Cynara cardunculus var. scolymus]KVH95619.1 EXTL2, alpha-1,4-N-acetylhexosaminyltransferase [Cynara cardunculus var. scolymus]